MLARLSLLEAAAVIVSEVLGGWEPHRKRTPSCMSSGRPDVERAALSSAWQLLMMLTWQPSARRSRVASWNRSCADSDTVFATGARHAARLR